MNTEWADFVADVRSSVQGFEEWPKDKGIGPICPVHGQRHLKRVTFNAYRCSLEKDGPLYLLHLDAEEGIRMLPTRLTPITDDGYGYFNTPERCDQFLAAWGIAGVNP